ncbi:hypothetical protein D3C85_1264370 [compost metagenome]
MYQPQRHLGQEVVAQEGPHALPEGNQHDQQRNRLHEIHVAQVRNIRKKNGVRVGQAIDKVFEHVAQHRLARRENQESKDT